MNTKIKMVKSNHWLSLVFCLFKFIFLFCAPTFAYPFLSPSQIDTSTNLQSGALISSTQPSCDALKKNYYGCVNTFGPIPCGTHVLHLNAVCGTDIRISCEDTRIKSRVSNRTGIK